MDSQLFSRSTEAQGVSEAAAESWVRPAASFILRNVGVFGASSVSEAHSPRFIPVPAPYAHGSPTWDALRSNAATPNYATTPSAPFGTHQPSARESTDALPLTAFQASLSSLPRSRTNFSKLEDGRSTNNREDHPRAIAAVPIPLNQPPSNDVGVKRSREGDSPSGISNKRLGSLSISRTKKRHRCPEPNCFTSCSRHSDLQRHYGTKHQVPNKTCYTCAASECSYSVTRLDKFRDHVKRKHSQLNMQDHIRASERWPSNTATTMVRAGRASSHGDAWGDISLSDVEDESVEVISQSSSRSARHSHFCSAERRRSPTSAVSNTHWTKTCSDLVSINTPNNVALDMWLRDEADTSHLWVQCRSIEATTKGDHRLDRNSQRTRETSVLLSCEHVERVFGMENPISSLNDVSYFRISATLEALELATTSLSVLRFCKKRKRPPIFRRSRSAPPLPRQNAPLGGDPDAGNHGNVYFSNGLGYNNSGLHTNTSQGSGHCQSSWTDDNGVIATGKGKTSAKALRMRFVCLLHHREAPEQDPSPDCRRARGKYLSNMQRHHERDDHRLFYCTRCFETFRTKPERESHTRSRNCALKCVNDGCGLFDQAPSPCPHENPENSPSSQWKALFRIYRPREPVPEPQIVDDDCSSPSPAPSNLSHASLQSLTYDIGAPLAWQSMPRMQDTYNNVSRAPDSTLPPIPNPIPRRQALQRLAGDLWRRVDSEDPTPSLLLRHEYEYLMALFNPSTWRDDEDTESRLLELFIHQLWLWVTNVSPRSFRLWHELKARAQALIPTTGSQNDTQLLGTPIRNAAHANERYMPQTSRVISSESFGDQNATFGVPPTAIPAPLGIPATNFNASNFPQNAYSLQSGFGVDATTSMQPTLSRSDGYLFHGSYQSSFEPFLHGNNEIIASYRQQTDQYLQPAGGAGVPNQPFQNISANFTQSTFPSNPEFSSGQTTGSFITDQSSLDQDWQSINGQPPMPDNDNNEKPMYSRSRPGTGSGAASSSRNPSFGSSDPNLRHSNGPYA